MSNTLTECSECGQHCDYEYDISADGMVVCCNCWDDDIHSKCQRAPEDFVREDQESKL